MFSADAPPMVSPLKVIMTVVLLEIVDVDVRDSTIDVDVGVALLAVTEVPLIVASGVADVKKKPVG